MSKVDAQRAMREARYARDRAAAAERPAVPRPAAAAGPVTRPTRPPAAGTRAVPDADVPPDERSQDVCGHRSMNGRTCTRESGHEQKNHRYG